MNDSNHDRRKRSHERDNADERRVRTRRNENCGPCLPRDRSRSPHRDTYHRSRPRSPPRHHHTHHHRYHHAPAAPHQDRDQDLPFNARQLSRSADLHTFRPLLARYLDVQKRIDISSLDERELRGRWKSFVGKWNNGELAEGWYRPETFEDAMLDLRTADNRLDCEGKRDRRDQISPRERRRGSVVGNIHITKHDVADSDDVGGRGEENIELRDAEKEDDDEDDDDYGPTLPTQDDANHVATSQSQSQSQSRHGPGIPTTSDLTLRRELEASDRQDALDQLRLARKADRAQQKERLDELVPRADPGSRARTLEKRREARDANASFAKAKAPNDMLDVPDAELMGGGVEEYKRMRREVERRKTEREVRREEMVRARREERDERVREYREREAHTVDMLRDIAKMRFG
ncbi:hypothetical protein GGS21DRAFT_517602 [Xylaria nigripes]|nr:hypothetical protein GGS21DRAFT_517602 [Xylaria nigripes]